MTFLVILLFITNLISLLGLVVAAAIVQVILKEVKDTKIFIDVTKDELVKFANEKQAFIERIEKKIHHSKLGGFLDL